MRGRIALACIALALLLRILVPSGFMPATGKGFAITLCTGSGAMQAWVDEQGQVHEGKTDTDKAPDQPCAFAGLGAALYLGSGLDALIAAPVAVAALFVLSRGAVAIGRGLAAPPPPSTGPPAAA